MNLKLSQVLLVVVGMLTVVACQSGDESSVSKNLDIVIEATPAFKQKQSAGWSTAQWEEFFRRTPTESERHILSKKVIPVDDADSSAELKALAERQIALGNLADADAALSSALRKDAKDVDLNIKLAELSVRRGDTSAAFDHLHRTHELIRKFPTTDESLRFRYRFVLANAHLRNFDFEEAKKIFADLIRIEKTFTPAYVGLANVYLSLEMPEMAQFIAKRALDRAKATAGLANTLGIIAAKLGDTVNAKRHFSDAIAIDKHYAPALINLSALLFEQGDRDAAEANLKRAAKIATSDASSFLALGICQRQMGQAKEAKLSLQRVLEINPENARARLELAQIFSESFADRETAIQLLREAVSLNDVSSSDIAQLYLDDLLSRGK